MIDGFLLMGARSSLAAQAERKRMEERAGPRRHGSGQILSDEEATKLVREQRVAHLTNLEDSRVEEDAKWYKTYQPREQCPNPLIFDD